MPLYKTISIKEGTTVKIWKITEPETELSEGIELKSEHSQRLGGMKSELHRRGFLSVRHLLKAFGYVDSDLFYDEHGKPHLKDARLPNGQGKQISITHSFTFSAVAVSDAPVGIDIEKQREKIKVIAHKFTGYETDYLNENEADYVRKLTVIWCAKESLYKLYATPGLSFKEHCLVLPFTFKDEETVAWIDYEGQKRKFNTKYLEFEGFTFAVAVPF